MDNEYEAIETQLEQLLDDDQTNRAVTLLLGAYGQQIYGFMVATLRNPTFAEEALAIFREDVFLRIGAFERTCDFRAWAYGLARNAIRKSLTPARRVQRLGTSTGEGLPHPSAPSADWRLEWLREQLTIGERELLVLYERGFTFEEIAGILTNRNAPVTANALSQRFKKVKQKLVELAKGLPAETVTTPKKAGLS